MKGGGVCILVPKILEPKERKDLCTIRDDLFESLWIECDYNRNTRQLTNISYCPQKALTAIFLDELQLTLDRAVTEGKPLVLMGDYNINYLVTHEKNKLDEAIRPYDLKVLNQNSPTRATFTKRSQPLRLYHNRCERELPCSSIRHPLQN